MSTRDIFDEDAIDTEALQAQIDLSMSFAQDLVSSWMAPHKSSTNSRKKNMEQELTEYMKRPPRLGVGAVIPEGGQSSMSRETARLKGKLAGKKRYREEEDVPAVKTVASDDEADSRVSAIKKKARPDPFNVVHGKKKKKAKDITTPVAHPGSLHSNGAAKTESDSGKVLDIVNSSATSQSSTKLGEGQKPAGHGDGAMGQTSKTLDIKPQSPHTEKPVTPVDSTAPKRKPVITTVEDSLSKTPGPKKNIPLELLKTPLLNLSGPPHISEPESEGEDVTGTPTSPKKKRKRRKKKKHLVAQELPPSPTTSTT
ncbi:hypothetical protein CPC08DRAFT_702048 [Agrocybe pediades]|nr:hypothetical protein CPC08DRAFT_702048 [Agrocybe pediades]